MSTSSARHEAPRNGRPVKRRLIRVLAGSAVIGAMAVGGLQFALGTAYAAGDVCDLCSTNYNPVACCSSGGSAYDSNPGGGIDVSAQKAAFDSYCANYKKEHAQKEEPATPAPATKPSNPNQSAPAPAKQSSGSPATQTTKPSTGNTTAQQSQPAQSTGTQSGQSTTGSTAGITGDTAANANADATATQTSKDAASRKNSDDNTADTAGGETTTTESGITDSGTDTAETTTQASPVTDRAETTSPVVRIVAGVVIALAVIGTLGAALPRSPERTAAGPTTDSTSQTARRRPPRRRRTPLPQPKPVPTRVRRPKCCSPSHRRRTDHPPGHRRVSTWPTAAALLPHGMTSTSSTDHRPAEPSAQQYQRNSIRKKYRREPQQCPTPTTASREAPSPLKPRRCSPRRRSVSPDSR